MLAKAIPSAILVDAGPAEDVVIVRDLFGESWDEIHVYLVQENGRWLIDNSQPAE